MGLCGELNPNGKQDLPRVSHANTVSGLRCLKL